LDNLYDLLADTYGKEIMMYCRRTAVVSGYREIVKPRARPDGG
jgi:hypothetical protein